jgi:glutathionyl-hydroquinone reductase
MGAICIIVALILNAFLKNTFKLCCVKDTTNNQTIKQSNNQTIKQSNNQTINPPQIIHGHLRAGLGGMG